MDETTKTPPAPAQNEVVASFIRSARPATDRKGGEDKVRHHMTAITRTMFAAYADFKSPADWSPADDLYRDAMVSWLLSLVPPEHVPAAARHLTERP